MIHIDEHIAQVNHSVAEASLILADGNPVLSKQWDAFPEKRCSIAGKYAAKFLLGRNAGYTSLPLLARKVWGAALDDYQHRLLFPEYFTTDQRSGVTA